MCKPPEHAIPHVFFVMYHMFYLYLFSKFYVCSYDQNKIIMIMPKK